MKVFLCLKCRLDWTEEERYHDPYCDCGGILVPVPREYFDSKRKNKAEITEDDILDFTSGVVAVPNELEEHNIRIARRLTQLDSEHGRKTQ